MLFSSIPFLFYFLPPVLLLYFLTPDRWKNLTLLLSSLVFYGWGEPRFLLFMLAASAQGYAFGRLMERYPRHKRLFLILSAVLSLSLLGYCKYAGFFLRTLGALTGLSLPALQIALPIGISFYTFQVLSYVIDVYRGTVPPQRNLLQLATYVAMFPQLIAGPIVRYADIAPELTRRRHTLTDAAAGARRFVVGLGKKVLIANVLYELMSAFLQSTQPSVLFTWLYAVACALQIYFDFSGYSDMAVGLGRIFGFHFPKNFRYPFLSGSVTEFWRRWHISLGSWFRDYVYIPLGGSRCSRSRWLLNVFLVWGLTGLWHGAAWNFVLWGLFFAVLLAAEKLWYGHGLEKTRLLKHLYMPPTSPPSGSRSPPSLVSAACPPPGWRAFTTSAATPSYWSSPCWGPPPCPPRRCSAFGTPLPAAPCCPLRSLWRWYCCWRLVRRIWWTAPSIPSCIFGFKEG